MKTEISLSLHENYVKVNARFYTRTALNYVEYSFFGSTVAELLRKEIGVSELKRTLETVGWGEDPQPNHTYLPKFNGHFTITYEVLDDNNITTFNVKESRMILPLHGGRSVSGAFRDEKFKDKIFMNLLNAVADRNVEKLNKVTGALYSIGGN